MPISQRRKAVIAAAVAAAVLGPLWLLNGYGLAVESDHSRFAASQSRADARARGVFVRNVEVTDTTVPWGSRTLRVDDAWIEERTQVMYTMALPWTRRVERLGTYRLMFSVVPTDRGAIHSDERSYLVSSLCVVLPNDSIVGIGTAPGADGLFTVAVDGRGPAQISVTADTRCRHR